MENDNRVLVGLAGGLVTLFLGLIGAAMAHDPPVPADGSVGKGLMAIAGAVAIVTVVYVLDSTDRRRSVRTTPAPPAPRSDWDEV